MRALRECALLGSLLAAAACSTLSAQEQPAVVADPTERSRAELERIVVSAMNGQRVTLAEDALTRDSTLTVERRTPAGAEGRAATGRTLEMPVRFDLLLRGSSCVLRAADGREWQLREARCVAAR
jgi:hypothetical protein